jgi:hypothetical protein
VKLSLFLHDLLSGGHVTVPRVLVDFEAADLDASAVLLEDLYHHDKTGMPYNAPAFDPDAALWAAGYVFRVSQFILLRDIAATEMLDWLGGFAGTQSPEAIYSADLTLRFLPDLFRLASGLAPDDPLVINLREIAVKWPYSSVGITGIDTPMICEHPSLRQAYLDRIIRMKDIQRLNDPVTKELLKEILGANQPVLWPELDLLQTEN